MRQIQYSPRDVSSAGYVNGKLSVHHIHLHHSYLIYKTVNQCHLPLLLVLLLESYKSANENIKNVRSKMIGIYNNIYPPACHIRSKHNLNQLNVKRLNAGFEQN